MKCTAIVLAAGKGSRMDSSIQKQFMDLGGFPLIYYSLAIFEESCVDDVILVAGRDDLEYCRTQVVGKYGFQKVRRIVPGGSERHLSVYEGLCAAGGTDIVLIHDGARPFVTDGIIKRAIQAAEEFGSGVAAVPVKDTVRIADHSQFSVETPDRSGVWLMQTPQAFRYAQILRAYEKIIGQHAGNVTDDAMALELAFGQRIKLVEGSYRNIKVTTPEDMEIAEVFASKIK